METKLTKNKKPNASRTAKAFGSGPLVRRIKLLRKQAFKHASECVLERMKAESQGATDRAKAFCDEHSYWCSYIRALDDVLTA